MLDHVGRNDLAQRMRSAIDQTLIEDKVRTGDLGGMASAQEFSQAIVRRLSYVEGRPEGFVENYSHVEKQSYSSDADTLTRRPNSSADDPF